MRLRPGRWSPEGRDWAAWGKGKDISPSGLIPGPWRWSKTRHTTMSRPCPRGAEERLPPLTAVRLGHHRLCPGRRLALQGLLHGSTRGQGTQRPPFLTLSLVLGARSVRGLWVTFSLTDVFEFLAAHFLLSGGWSESPRLSGLRKVLQESIIPRRHCDQCWRVTLFLVVLIGKEDNSAKVGQRLLSFS